VPTLSCRWKNRFASFLSRESNGQTLGERCLRGGPGQAVLHSLCVTPHTVSGRGDLVNLQVAEGGSRSPRPGAWNDSVGVCLPPAVMKKGSEPQVVLMTDLAEKVVQESGLAREAAPVLGTKPKAGKVRR